ncbi:MAG: AraC family transcriptional regulator, partial [Mesorhizobium sp.]
MLENPRFLRESTEMAVDPFSDVLTLTNAEAVVTGGFTAGGPWAISFPGRDKIKFFAVVKG